MATSGFGVYVKQAPGRKMGQPLKPANLKRYAHNFAASGQGKLRDFGDTLCFKVETRAEAEQLADVLKILDVDATIEELVDVTPL